MGVNLRSSQLYLQYSLICKIVIWNSSKAALRDGFEDHHRHLNCNVEVISWISRRVKNGKQLIFMMDPRYVYLH